MLRRNKHIKDRAGYRDFLGRNAAFVSQKCTIEYCRVRAGYNWDLLMRERPFLDALEICRWDALAFVLADLAVIAEGWLRPHAAAAANDDAILADRLVADVAATLAAHPVPAHRPEGWGGEIEALRQRLAAVRMAAPKPVHEVGKTAGGRIFDTLPIHPSLRTHDRELITNNIRFNLCRAFEDMEAEVDPVPVAADFVAVGGHA